jgi:8-oxo-dGTP diphosphatase
VRGKGLPSTVYRLPSKEDAGHAVSSSSDVRRETVDDRPVRVVAAVLYDNQGRILIAQRPPGKHMAGRWEFPGGKIAPNESERAALDRELFEEIGIRVLAARPLMRLAHDYADRLVELSLWVVERYSGEVTSLDGQSLKWVAPNALAHEDMLEADRPFVEALERLPPLAT